MGWWERNALPRVIDMALGTPEVHRLRASSCRHLAGRVLEVGFGSGLNLEHYPAAVWEVVAVEPNDTAWRLAEPRVRNSPVPVVRSGMDGQRLELPDESFDQVLLTFVLCTIPDVGSAVAEARRVLRPGGTVHFLEHGLAPEASVQRWQRRLEPLQKRLGAGCHLTRQPVEALAAVGFEVHQVQTFYAPGPRLTKPLGHLYQGIARKAA